MKKNKTKLMRYSICFLLLLLLCWMFPYTGDDWTWGSKIGMDRLDVWFYAYNGRYVGNLLVLALTRSNILKTLVMAFCLTGIIYLVEHISRKKWSFYISCIGLLLIPKEVLGQAIVWTSGFTNYVFPVFLLLIFIAYAYPVFQETIPKYKLWHCLPLLVLGFISSLIMENITIYNVVLTIGIIIYTIVVHHKVVVSHMIYLLASLAGTFYMFSNGAYHNIINSGNTYQQVAAGGVANNIEKNYVEIIAKYLCFDNVWVNITILIVCMLLFYQCRIYWKNKKETWVAKLCMIVLIAYNVWALLSVFGLNSGERQKALLYMEALFVSIYMLALLVFSIIVGIHKKSLWKILFWNASIICLTVPLLVVNPIGPRCFFPTYILFILLLVELASQLNEETVKSILDGKCFQSLCSCISLVGILFYLNIFWAIYQVDCDRLARIERQVAIGKTSVEICYLPYRSYLWNDVPAEWGERFKLFHNLPQDLELKPVLEYSDKSSRKQ